MPPFFLHNALYSVWLFGCILITRRHAPSIWNGYHMYSSSTEAVPVHLLRAVPGTQAGDLRWSSEKNSAYIVAKLFASNLNICLPGISLVSSCCLEPLFYLVYHRGPRQAREYGPEPQLEESTWHRGTKHTILLYLGALYLGALYLLFLGALLKVKPSLLSL